MRGVMRSIGIVIICATIVVSGAPSLLFGDPPSLVKVKIDSGGSINYPIIDSPLIDDFDDGVDPNLWGGFYQSFVSEVGGEDITASYDSANRIGGSGYGYKIEYAVPNSASYVGVKIEVAPGGGTKNVSSYEYFTFWVKGSTNNIPVKIEFQNASGNTNRDAAQLYISDYLDGGVRTSWQEVRIPLDGFANLDSFTNVKGIVFVFEHDYAVTSGNPTAGVLYIDDVGFGQTALNTVRVDHFSDNSGLLAIGGNIGSMEDHSFSFDTSEFHNYARSMRSDYNVSNDPFYCGFFMLFGGGSDGWTAQECNFSAYNDLTLWLKASPSNPKVCKLEIVDGSGAKASIYLDGITTSWQQYRIDLNALTELNKSRITQMNIIYEKNAIGDNGIEDQGGDENGVLYFDEIQFER